MSNKNNSPEQKKAWKMIQQLSAMSSFHIRVTPATRYSPEKKAPSRRDLHRFDVAGRKKK